MKAKTQSLLAAAAIAALGAWTFAPAFQGGWIWDDAIEVAQNPALRSAGGLGRIWLGKEGADYFPLKSTIQWLEWHLWDGRVAGYHLVNFSLHLLGAFLLWHVLRKLGARWAPLGGLLFAIHPQAVESVAWISELKNVLSLPPLLLAMSAYIDYVRTARRRDLGLSVVWFLTAMLCKSSVVMFPVVLLLFAWWRRGRIGRRDWLATAPFFVISLTLGLVTVFFQRQRAMGGMADEVGGGFHRIAAAGWAAAFYLSKAIIPVRLMFFYPRWAMATAELWQLMPWLLGGSAFWWLWSRRDAENRLVPWARHTVLGLGWFMINLVPVLGFAPIAYFRFSRVADHLAYVPLVGIAGLAAAAGGLTRGRRALAVGMALACAGLAWESHRSAEAFRNEMALWSSALRRNPEAWLPHNGLGNIFLSAGRLPEAIEQFESVLRIHPDAEAHNNLGHALARSGRNSEAMQQFEASLRIKPDYAEANNNLGNALLRAGRIDEAISHYGAALRQNPDFLEAHLNLGNVLHRAGRQKEAMGEYEAALRLDPDSLEAHAGLGSLLLETGRIGDAIAQQEAVLRANPDDAQAHNNLGNAFLRAGWVDKAIAQYEAALQQNPGLADAHLNLGNAWHRAGRRREANEEYEAALRLDPNSAAAHTSLGSLLLETGRIAEAIAQQEAAVRLNPGSAEMQTNLGNALVRGNRITEAIGHYERAVRIAPGLVAAQYNLANVLAGTGRPAEAIPHYQAVLLSNPDFAPARENLRRAEAQVQADRRDDFLSK